MGLFVPPTVSLPHSGLVVTVNTHRGRVLAAISVPNSRARR